MRPSLRPGWRRAARGMTLLELIATLIILGGLITALMEIKRSSMQARRVVNSTLNVIDQADGGMDVLVRDLEAVHAFDSRAYLIVEKREVAQRPITSIAFSCLTPIRVSEELREKPGLVEIAYLVGEDPNNENALAVFRRELTIETDRSAAEIRTSDQGLVLLADGLSELDMEFLPPPEEDEPANGRETEYVNEWEGGFGAENMPAAIRIRVSTDHNEDRDKALVFQRTVRLPIPTVTDETLQPALTEILELEE